jgi:cysteine dioxygenase
MIDIACIKTINDLIVELDEQDKKYYPRILKSLQIPIEKFYDIAEWEADHYSRVCVAKNEKFELLLLCWNGHDQTPIHDHDGQKCWVYQLDGQIEEKRYNLEGDNELVEVLSTKLTPRNLTYMDDNMGFHSLINASSSRSLTLHLYVNPIEECSVYCEDSKEFHTKSMSYCKDLSGLDN